jgi:hypothetical protein
MAWDERAARRQENDIDDEPHNVGHLIEDSEFNRLMQSVAQGNTKRLGLDRPPASRPLLHWDKRGCPAARRFSTGVPSIDRGQRHFLFILPDQGCGVHDHRYLRSRLASGPVPIESF